MEYGLASCSYFAKLRVRIERAEDRLAERPVAGGKALAVLADERAVSLAIAEVRLVADAAAILVLERPAVDLEPVLRLDLKVRYLAGQLHVVQDPIGRASCGERVGRYVEV